MLNQAQPGWYPDPGNSNGLRYWDGAKWTEHRTDASPRPSASVAEVEAPTSQVVPASHSGPRRESPAPAQHVGPPRVAWFAKWPTIVVVGLLYLLVGIASMGVLLILLAYPLYLYIRAVRKEYYFAGNEFQAHKAAIASVVAEHNEVCWYTSEIRAKGSFNLGVARTGQNAHLAAFQNTSRHKYRRDRNVATYEPHVHNCSMQVVRNASADPIKYLMKYFGIKAEEDTLGQVEALGESVGRLEAAVANLQAREAAIADAIRPPKFIVKHYLGEFMAQVGVELSPVTIPYQQYSFEYVSAGGNSSQRTEIVLNSPTIDALVETLSGKIRWRKSVVGQRALMTAKFREHIKSRDGYTCRQCSVALADQPHLLLEVDHIIPVSRGGMSTEENLQTLCWRCNRTKSNKIPAAQPGPQGPPTDAARNALRDAPENT